MAERFAMMDDAIARGTLKEPKLGFLNTYFWYANFYAEDKHKTGKVNFSLGAFWLGVFWYVHFGLIKEAFILMMGISLLIGLLPPNLPKSLNYGFSIGVGYLFAAYFTGSRYAKYKLSGRLSPGGNIFLTILVGGGIYILTIILATIVSGIIYR